jgi:Tol biopolymer transport system component
MDFFCLKEYTRFIFQVKMNNISNTSHHRGFFILSGLGVIALFLAILSGAQPESTRMDKARNWPDGAEALTTDGADDWAPVWSPDGSLLAYQTYRYASPDIFCLEMKSGETFPAAMFDVPVTTFRWKNGTHLVYALPSGGQRRIRTTTGLMKASPKEGSRLALDGGEGSWYGWDVSRDGGTIAALGYMATPERYYYLRLFDTRSDEYSDLRLTFPTGISEVLEIALSADGRQCAIMAEARTRRPDIFVADTSTGKVRRLTEDGEEKHGLSWSPKGSLIAFLKQQAWSLDDQKYEEERKKRREDLSRRMAEVRNEMQAAAEKFRKAMESAKTPEDKQTVAKEWQETREKLLGEDPADGTQDRKRGPSRRDKVLALYVIDARGGEPDFILGDAQSAGDPCWHPDGKHIICSTGFGETWNLVSVNVRSKKTIPLTKGDWRDFSPSISPGGSRVAFVSSRTGDLDIFQIKFKGN